MSSGPRQHIVPVQMIRRFANADGMLFCLKKENLVVPDKVHGNAARDILYRRHYYKGEHYDWDRDWLRPREDAFAELYPKLADDEAKPRRLSSEESKVFIEWTASLQARSELLREAVDARNSTEYIKQCSGVTITGSDLANLQRQMFAKDYESLYTSPGWVWRLMVLKLERSMVLSDHPVGHTTINDPIGLTVFVPLSKTRLIVGGTKKGLDKLEHTSVDKVNLFMASWANRLIYAESVETLQTVAEQLRCASEAARLPFYGVIQRMRTEPVPRIPGVEESAVFDHMKKIIGKSDSQ